MKKSKHKYFVDIFLRRGEIVEYWVNCGESEKHIATKFNVCIATVRRAIAAYHGNGDYVTMDIKAE